MVVGSEVVQLQLFLVLNDNLVFAVNNDDDHDDDHDDRKQKTRRLTMKRKRPGDLEQTK